VAWQPPGLIAGNASVANAPRASLVGQAGQVTKEILDGGAPERDAVQRRAPRWSRTVTGAVSGSPAGGPSRLSGVAARWERHKAGRRWAALGLVGALLLAGGAWLRSGASHLESPRPERAAPASAPPSGDGSAFASWTAPVLLPGGAFALTVQAGERLVRIEHGRERTQQIPFPGRRTFAAGGWTTAEETVVVKAGPGGQNQVAVVLDRAGRELRQIGPAARILPGPHGWTVWAVRAAGTAGLTLQGYTLDGVERGPASAVPAGTEPVTVLRDAVVLSAPDRTLSLWRPGGDEPKRIRTSGRVVSASNGLIVVAHDCDGTEPCRHSLVNTASGRITRLPGASRMRPLGDPVLSRDGLWIATVVEPDTGDGRDEAALAVATVFDGGGTPVLVPGSRYRPPAGTPLVRTVVAPAWSLDGLVFGYAPGGAGLYAYQPGEAGARRLDVPGLRAVMRIVAG